MLSTNEINTTNIYNFIIPLFSSVYLYKYIFGELKKREKRTLNFIYSTCIKWTLNFIDSTFIKWIFMKIYNFD